MEIFVVSMLEQFFINDFSDKYEKKIYVEIKVCILTYLKVKHLCSCMAACCGLH